MRPYLADLHIHTCLSPCADDEMIPLNILNMARLVGLEILGICDHNSAKNLEVMQRAAKDYDIMILPGIEVQSVEEVHILCYFSDVEKCLFFQEVVYEHLPDIENRPDIFGHQWIVDERGNILGEEEQLLITSTDMTVEAVQKKVRELGGMLIPAHIDRGSFSLYGQLGFMPQNLLPDAMEYSKKTDEIAVRRNLRVPENITLTTASDSHRLADMVFQRMHLYLASLNFEEIRKALCGAEGRKVIVQ